MNIRKILLVINFPLVLLGQAYGQDAPNLEIGGRLQADSTNFDNDKYQYSDGSELRRARLFVRGDLSENWDYKVQVDFAPDNSELKDGYIRYNGFSNTRITFGNFKQYSGLEALTSSNNISFTERALPDVLTAGRRLGVGYQTWSERFNLAVSMYDNEANNLVRGKGLAARFAYRPQMGEGKLLHLGLALAREKADDDTARLRARPESHQDSHRIINTDRITNIKSFSKLGLEAVYVNGRFSAQSEFIRQSLQRKLGPDLSFGGYYVYASYFLTNDSRPYSSLEANFGAVSPTSPKGAWEIAARISNLDLSDRDIAGGEADIISLAVNYYMTSDLRFTANYILADSDKVAGDDDPNALQLRIRFTF